MTIFAETNKKKMKSNVTMKSKDRDLFGYIIPQDTKTGFLSLSHLQDAYAQLRVKNGWVDRRVEGILSNEQTSERIYYILSKQQSIKADYHAFMEEVKTTSLVKVLKKYGVYKTTGARASRRVMCNPYVWVLVAMEMNPVLYAEVVTWLTDKLILNRIEAGDRHNDLMRSICKFKTKDFAEVAKAVNWVVFNNHEVGIRNTATAEELREVDNVQKNLAFAIDMGFIKTYDGLMDSMRTLWAMRHGGKNALKS